MKNTIPITDVSKEHCDRDSIHKCICNENNDTTDERRCSIKETCPCADEEVIEEPYETVNHPKHYNTYGIEVIDMMLKIFGEEKVKNFCELSAFKYRMRAGSKPGNATLKDLAKEEWFLNKKKELEK